MTTFLQGAGLVLTTKRNRSSAYKIKDAEALSSILQQGPSNGSVALVTNIDIQDQDLPLPIVGTDDYRVLFQFGRDFGMLTIVLTVFMGAVDGPCKSKGKILSQINQAFEQIRLSSRQKPISVSIADGKAYKCYPVKLMEGQVDAEHNSIQVQINCILAPTPR